MTHSDPSDYALSGSIRIGPDAAEEEFRAMRDEVCDEFARSEGTRLPGQLTRPEYAITVVVLVASFVAILLCR